MEMLTILLCAFLLSPVLPFVIILADFKFKLTDKLINFIEYKCDESS